MAMANRSTRGPIYLEREFGGLHEVPAGKVPTHATNLNVLPDVSVKRSAVMQEKGTIRGLAKFPGP